MRINVSTCSEIIGLVCLLVASFAMDWKAGTALVGCCLLAAGYLLGDAPEVEP